MPDAVDVLFPLPLGPLTYLAPLEDGRQGSPLGRRVIVPWQTGVRVGIVVGARVVDAGRGLELRHALRYLGDEPYLQPEQVKGVDSIARGAGVPAGLVLATLGVPGLNPDLEHEVQLRGSTGAELLGDLPRGEWLPAERVETKALELLRSQGLLDEAVRVKRQTRRVLVPSRQPDDGLEGPRSINQRLALERLWELEEVESAAALAREVEVSQSAVRSLITKGYAEYAEVEVEPQPPPAPPLLDDRLEDPAPGATAPRGDGYVVGGSRRERLTALLPVLSEDVRDGESVVVVAPENSVAREAAALLATRLPVRFLTGDASDDQREAMFDELPSAGPVVVVGSHLALLAPAPQVGRFVVLEAGNQTHKLRSGARLWLPKATKRLAAALGARFTQTDVVGSPELIAMGEGSEHTLLPLPDVRVHVADMTGSPNWPLHPDLLLAYRQVVERGRQALFVAPRRGFSGAYGCHSCGWLAPCPNCDLSLRFHREEGTLRCHQCGHQEPVPQVCPSCGETDLGALKGAGTQWLLAQLQRLEPEHPLYRYDADRRDELSSLYAGEPGAVVGTTALLRLQPLPNLSLIAIGLFDVHLALADFRAEHEALRMLLQLAELSVARRPLVVVQTFAPDNQALRAVASDTPDAAVQALLGLQLERRKRFGYPPFTTLAKVQVTAREQPAASRAAQTTADRLRLAGAGDDEILGPEAAPVARVKGRFAYQLLIRAVDEDRMESLLSSLPDRLPAARLTVDVDPVDVGELIE